MGIAADIEAEIQAHPENTGKSKLRGTNLTYAVIAAAIVLSAFFIFYFRKR